MGRSLSIGRGGCGHRGPRSRGEREPGGMTSSGTHGTPERARAPPALSAPVATVRNRRRSGQPFLEAPERLDGVNLVDLNLFRGEGDHVPDDSADKGGKHGRDQPSEHLDASPQTIRPVTYHGG